MSLRRGFPVLLDLALIQVGILISYLAKFGDELPLHRNVWGSISITWSSSILAIVIRRMDLLYGPR